MPTIKQQVEANQTRIAAGGATGTGAGPQQVTPAPTMAPVQDLPAGGGLPQRGMFPADLTLNSDRSDSNRAFRGAGVRSSTFPFAPVNSSASKTIVEVAQSSSSSSGGGSSSVNLTAGPGIQITQSGKSFTIGGTTGQLAVPSIFSVSGAMVLTAFPNGGTIAIELTTEPTNSIFAGPASGGADIPTFRSMVVADLPTTGTWPFAGVMSGNFTISGNVTIDGELIDSLASPGMSGQVLSSTGTAVKWIASPSGGGGAVVKTASYNAASGDNGKEIVFNTAPALNQAFQSFSADSGTLSSAPLIGDVVILWYFSEAVTTVVPATGASGLGVASWNTISGSPFGTDTGGWWLSIFWGVVGSSPTTGISFTGGSGAFRGFNVADYTNFSNPALVTSATADSASNVSSAGPTMTPTAVFQLIVGSIFMNSGPITWTGAQSYLTYNPIVGSGNANNWRFYGLSQGTASTQFGVTGLGTNSGYGSIGAILSGEGSLTYTLLATPASSTWSVHVACIGPGTLTINPNGTLLDESSASLVLYPGQGVYLTTDGTNYFTERGAPYSVVPGGFVPGQNLTGFPFQPISDSLAAYVGLSSDGTHDDLFLGFDRATGFGSNTGLSFTTGYSIIGTNDLFCQLRPLSTGAGIFEAITAIGLYLTTAPTTNGPIILGPNRTTVVTVAPTLVTLAQNLALVGTNCVIHSTVNTNAGISQFQYETGGVVGSGEQAYFGFIGSSAGLGSRDNCLELGTTVAGAADVTIRPGEVEQVRVYAAGGVGLNNPTGGSKGAGTINAAGAYYANGTAGVSSGGSIAPALITTINGIVTAITAVSDERLKNVLGSFDRGLDAILAITPQRYTWNVEGQKKTGATPNQEFAGFIAQDVQRAIPEAINWEGEYLSLAERPIVAALVNAVKELNAKVTALELQKE